MVGHTKTVRVLKSKLFRLGNIKIPGGQHESWDDGDVSPCILGENPCLRIFGQFPYPFL